MQILKCTISHSLSHGFFLEPWRDLGYVMVAKRFPDMRSWAICYWWLSTLIVSADKPCVIKVCHRSHESSSMCSSRVSFINEKSRNWNLAQKTKITTLVVSFQQCETLFPVRWWNRWYANTRLDQNTHKWFWLKYLNYGNGNSRISLRPKSFFLIWFWRKILFCGGMHTHFIDWSTEWDWAVLLMTKMRLWCTFSGFCLLETSICFWRKVAFVF